jgi:hypothetical protein
MPIFIDDEVTKTVQEVQDRLLFSSDRQIRGMASHFKPETTPLCRLGGTL